MFIYLVLQIKMENCNSIEQEPKEETTKEHIDKKTDENNKSHVKRFEIQKDSSLTYNPTINYYQEYWKMYYDNEYLLAQIKENAYEINSMKAHIEEISK